MDEMQDVPNNIGHYVHDLEKENRVLKEENQQFRKVFTGFEKRLNCLELENQKLKEENKELKKTIIKLEKRLRMYENPHTPSSRKCFKKGKNSDKDTVSSSGRRGAPKGHKGATRKKSKPDEVIPVPSDHCPGCGCNPGLPKGFETLIVEELPPPREIKVIQYELFNYTCPSCGLKFTSKHKDCPQKGIFGINLLTQITTLKYHLRGVLRKIEEYLRYVYNFKISSTGVHDVLLRVGGACKNEYMKIQQRIQNARWVYEDETGVRVNGENWWLWTFRSNNNDVLIKIRNSRGRKVLEEVNGGNFDIPGIADGWSAYSILSILQRCWAHLLRDVDDFKEKSEKGKELSEELHRKFKKLKDFLGKDPPMDKRKKQKITWDKEITELVQKYSQFDELHKPVTYIKNGLGRWYTCLLYPSMEPTNNLGEHTMRENVIMEKIIGSFRSIKGAENYQYIASMFATWRFQGKNIFEELETLLRQELCLS
ncbi:MAG: IS66 family transposase [Thermoplasmata archaeon]|nr:MAG: IS66 family transposase [Thermoplasmata archaeon]